MKTIFFASRIFMVISISILSFGFIACNKSVNDNTVIPVSGLLAANLAPGKSVSIALSGSTISGVPLSYTSFTGGYLNIYPGTRQVDAYDNGSASTIASQSYNFAPNEYYSLFVVGANGVYRDVIVHDNFDSLSATSGQAYIRYINAIPDSSQPGVTITSEGNNVLTANPSYASVSDFTAINPGQVSISVNNGSTIDASRTITLEQKKAYTILLVGLPGSTSSTDSVQIRYIENGTLENNSTRAISSPRSTNTD